MSLCRSPKFAALVLLISFILYSPASAEINAAKLGYCIEQRADPTPIKEKQTGRIKPTNRNYSYSVEFPSLGVTTIVSGEWVYLADTDSNFSISEKVLKPDTREVFFNGFTDKARFDQPDSPGIENIKISGKGGWLHIYGNEVNYTVQVMRESGMPRFGTSKSFPSLTRVRCSPSEELYGSCRGRPIHYSESLQRTFISGFRRSYVLPWFSWFDLEPESIEIDGGATQKLVNSEGKPLYFVADIDFPQAAILRDAHWNPYVYDGSEIRVIEGVKGLSSAIRRAGTRELRWAVQSAPALGKTYFRTKKVWFELVAGTTLDEISVPASLNKGWTKRLSIPGRKESWLFTLDRIFIQSGSEFEVAIRPPAGRRFYGPAKIGLAKAEPSIVFSTSDLHFKNRQHYLLRWSEEALTGCRPIDKVLPR